MDLQRDGYHIHCLLRLIKTSNVWSYSTNFTGCERRFILNGFRFKVLQVAQAEPQRKRGEAWDSVPPPNPPSHKTYLCSDGASAVSYITKI